MRARQESCLIRCKKFRALKNYPCKRPHTNTHSVRAGQKKTWQQGQHALVHATNSVSSAEAGTVGDLLTRFLYKDSKRDLSEPRRDPYGSSLQEVYWQNLYRRSLGEIILGYFCAMALYKDSIRDLSWQNLCTRSL